MKLKLHFSTLFFCLSCLPLARFPMPPTMPPSIPLTKTAVYIQTAASGAVASPKFPYNFRGSGFDHPQPC